MLKKRLYLALTLTSFLSVNFAHATPQSLSIPLTRLDKSTACDLSPSLKVVDNYAEIARTQRFEIDSHQTLKISLLNQHKTACYQFTYEPSYSPILIYKMTKNKLVITEMVGTFENGHQLENTYKIQTHPLSLVFIQAKFIDYIRHDNPKTKRSEVQKVISDW